MRIPVEKDSQGNDITPTKEEFLKKGSRRVPVPSAEEGNGKDIQCTALISDLILTAEELGSIKRMHWSIENRLHHVLDDTFRDIMTEMMDCFCDNATLREQYVFQGIASLY